MKMQKSILPKFEISILGKFGFQKNTKSAPHNFKKNTKLASQNLKLDCDFEFSIQKSIFENSKSLSSIPLEYHFETPKFEFSDVENP